HLIRLTLIQLKKNGRKLKQSADKKDVLSMSFSNSAFNNQFIGGWLYTPVITVCLTISAIKAFC
ncbi:MAG: hypothetical protein Q7U23_13555, partial [Methylococcales bacterium]|nr:hypothetical protein [Methylococcales bacterium]